MEPDQLAGWVAEATGERVTGIERIALGFSRSTFLVTTVAGRELVARLDVPDGPLAGTQVSLAREREVHQALRGQRLPRPELIASAADGSALLFERSPGTHELGHLTTTDREAVLDDYLDRIADLHLLRPDELDLPSRRAEAGTNPIVAELDRWEAALDRRSRRPWPLLSLAFRALRRHAAEPEPAELVLCHGDVGPRNFLHDGRRVTALLDWEFWHVGEPFDDLAWWIWRAHERSCGCGDLPTQLRRWSARTGIALDGRRIDYYTVAVRLRSVVVAVVALDNQARGVDHSVLLPIVWTLSYQIARDLLHLDGAELDLYWAATEEPSAAFGEEALGYLGRDVRELLVPDAGTPEARRQAGAVLTYAEHLVAVARLGPSVRQADDADLRRLIGLERDSDRIDQCLDELVRGGHPEAELTQLLGRRAYRRLQLWPSAFARSATPPIRIADLLGSGA